MQIVKYGKKQRTVKVPTDWAFVLNGKKVDVGDKVFNSKTHCWDDASNENIGKVICESTIVIRKYQKAAHGDLDRDTHAVRISA